MFTADRVQGLEWPWIAPGGAAQISRE